MKILKSKRVGARFDGRIYQYKPVFITSDKFWDGGIRTDSALKEKSEFYAIAHKMSHIIQQVVLELDEDPLVGAPFCEGDEIYAHWSDLESYELFRKISETIQWNKCYTLSLPEDSDVIDLIVESNFRYFTYVSLYLPVSNIIIQPSCHTEILVYSENSKETLAILQNVLEKHSCSLQEIRIAE